MLIISLSRIRRAPVLFLNVLAMLSLCSGFLPLKGGRHLSSMSSKLDDLLDEMLSGHANVTTPATTDIATANQWREIDWLQEEERQAANSTSPSPVEIQMIRDRLVYFKRDDQLRLPGSQISGNKARKMWTLNHLEDFPSCLVSYGGPQSNAMLALAAVVHFHNLTEPTRLVYYTKKLPRLLKNQPNGNLFRALSLGMELRELTHPEYKDWFGGDFGGQPAPPAALAPPDPDAVWIPQGGALSGLARAGTRRLAQEIVEYWSSHGHGRPLTVVVPGGTCSTAALLHDALQDCDLDIRVMVVPCVGDAGYARRQMLSILTQERGRESIPDILGPQPESAQLFGQATSGYFSFGEPHEDILKVFREMEESGVVLDLLYGAPAWTVLLRHWRSLPEDRELMYVHSGGLEGINSQLLRYKYKGLVEDVQLPGKK